MSLTIAPADTQMKLLDVLPVWNCTNNATARNAYGSAAQEIVCRTLPADPIPINGNFDVCFDARDLNWYYEIKSVRRSGKVVIYDFRIRKEAASGCPFKYAILVHNLIGAREDILKSMLKTGVEILIIDGAKVHEISKSCPLNKIQKVRSNRKTEDYNGYTRAGYADGYYNVPVHALRKVAEVRRPDTLFF